MLDRVFLSGGAGGGGWIAHVGSAQENVPQAIALDSDKNIYLNSYTTNPSGQYGYGVIKLSNLGVIQWQRKLSKGSSNAIGVEITVDSSNNVYAVGYFPLNGSRQSGVLAKYNSSGTLQWQRGLNPNNGNIYPNDVTTDSSGNVYFAGDGSWTGNPTYNCGFYTKYNSSGTFANTTKAVKVYSAYSTRSDGANSVRIDTSGNIYVCGYCSDYYNFRYPSTAYNIYLAKFDSANNFLWVKKLIGNNSDYGNKLAFDSSGNVYIAAQTKYVTDHSLLLKYNASGVLQWQRQLGDTSFNGSWTNIAVDGSGNIYCAGYSTVAGSADALFAKYNSSGTLQWQRRLGLNGGSYISEYGEGLTVDSDGNLYACVSFYTSTYQMLVAKLPPDGSGTGTYSVGSVSIVYAATTLTDSTPSYTHDTDYGLAGGDLSSTGSVTSDLNDSALTLTSVVTQI